MELRTLNKMENEELEQVGELHKRTEKMADGERYIIFYTFGEEEKEESENV